jgi:hypothetical protein
MMQSGRVRLNPLFVTIPSILSDPSQETHGIPSKRGEARIKQS